MALINFNSGISSSNAIKNNENYIVNDTNANENNDT